MRTLTLPCLLSFLILSPLVLGHEAEVSLPPDSNKDQPSAQDLSFYETHIRPVFIKHCYSCHSTQAENLKANLLLDRKSGWLKGGDLGPAIIPGQAEKSLLFKAISYEDPDLQMPPKSPLPAEVIKKLKTWIQNGASAPGDEAVIQPKQEIFDLQKRKTEHWAWQPQRKIGREESIDFWIQRKLTEKELKPAPQATPRVLLRRLFFDLIGLPPSQAEMHDFLSKWNVNQDRAWIEQVSTLLNSPHFGEHWARHWLDVVRYSETKGHVTDQERPHSWKYRDYVIDSLNRDLPYDQFLREHLAGDLLSPEEQRAGPQGQSQYSLIATGALFQHEMHFMAVDPVKQRWDEVNAQIDIYGKAILGLTLECARCHDHKFDAISQKDYYALAGFFMSTELGKRRTAPRKKYQPKKQARISKLEQDYKKFLQQKRAGRLRAQSPKVKGKIYFPISDELGIQSPGDTARLFKLMRQVENEDPSFKFWARSAVDAGSKDAPFLIRGEPSKPSKEVPRNFLTALPELNRKSEDPSFKTQSGRLWLANQTLHPKNPLPSRVWVNRLWHHLFGSGIVSTPNNFGKLGSAPSHPELLDYLAQRLRQSKGSTKTIIKEIVSSETYRRSSQRNSTQSQNDPKNKFLSRQNRRRLTAEQIRDALLKVSGTLDRTLYGQSIDCYVPPYATANKQSNVPRSGPLDGAHRRSIYLKVRRNFYDPFLVTFNFPDRGRSVGKRNVTITPSQSLAMLNSPLVHEFAQDWAKQLTSKGTPSSLTATWMWEEALGAPPKPAEFQLLSETLEELTQTSSASNPQRIYKDLAHILFNHVNFIWID